MSLVYNPGKVEYIMYKTVKQLLAEKAIVESKIRAYRVTAVRAAIAKAITSGQPVSSHAMGNLTKLNSMIEAIHYIHADVDDLLDQLEVTLED